MTPENSSRHGLVTCPFKGDSKPKSNVGMDKQLLQSIDHVQLAAPPGCEDEARRFFGTIFGLAEVKKPEALETRGGCWFKGPGVELHIGIEEPFTPSRKAHPAFSVIDIDSVARILESHHILLSWDNTIPDVRRFYISDPWGNRIELIER